MSNRDILLRQISAKKPRLKPTSANSYLMKLKCINKGLGVENEYDLEAIKHKDIIDEYLQGFKLNTRKTYLGAIITILDCCAEDCEEELKEYRKDLEAFQSDTRKAEEKQEKTARQDENWVSLKDLREVLEEYKKKIDLKNFDETEEISKRDFDLLQKYLVGMLYIGDVDNHPPLRLDYAPMVIKHISKWEKATEKENSLVIINKDKKFFSLVDYKTEGTYGLKTIQVSPELNDTINFWLKFNKSKSFLLNQRLKPMTANDLSKYIVKVFSPTGKKIGATMLRHIVISELFPARLEEQQKTADLMLHSINQQNLYAKKI